MSPSGDRVSVPTNGHHRPLAGEIAEPVGQTPADAGPSMPIGVTSPGLDRLTLRPGHVIAVVGAVVSLVLLLVGLRRGRDDR